MEIISELMHQPGLGEALKFLKMSFYLLHAYTCLLCLRHVWVLSILLFVNPKRNADKSNDAESRYGEQSGSKNA